MKTIKKNSFLQEEYKTSLLGWTETTNNLHTYYKTHINKNWNNAKYIVRNLPTNPMKLVICPCSSLMNFAPNQQHRIDYATGTWDGSSAEAVVDENGDISGVNVILHQPRLKRFEKSLKARGYSLPFPIKKFSQSILDIVAVHGKDIFYDENKSLSRIYIRPSAGSGVGEWGIHLKNNHFIESNVLVFRWGNYFNHQSINEINEGITVAITGAQRTFKIIGKHASNYGSASVEGSIIRNFGYNELIYLAPYILKNGRINFNYTDKFDKLKKYGVIADGAGEEVIALLEDGITIIYPPMRVNRLGGTVLDYIIKYLAPLLGLHTKEQDITLDQIRKRKIIGLAFVGNAVKVTPIKKIDILENINNNLILVETLFEEDIHKNIIKIKNKFEEEISGKIKPSHNSLLTPINLEWGKSFREYLDNYWTNFGY